MLFNAPIKNTNQSQIRRTKAILIVPALLSALLLSSCSEDEAPEQLPVTKVSLPKNPTQDYDYLLNGVQIDDNYMWLEQKTPQRTDWLEQQVELSKQYFSRLDQGIEAFKQVESALGRKLPQQFINLYFYIKEDPATLESSITVYDTIKEIETNLGALPAGMTAVSTSLSPHGRYLAIQTQNSQKQYRWLIFDLTAQQFNSYRLPATHIQTQFNWLAGHNRFIYQTDHQLYYQNLGQGPDFSQVLFDLTEHIDTPELWSISTQLTPDGQ